ncbi:Fc.00g029550.m01.CDS01 [Cosmosporella sp. VM-42]
MDDTIVLFRPLSSDEVAEVDPAFDEEKCRNVLVRYCAHIPRNYQYRDGIRLVFLVLRDHLGDECLGLAAGVLYEMIEVDCQHSDDPGAAFQRWRHDHLKRHADLDLPHVPHLTTVSSTIIPTNNLIQWRNSHPQRYPTRLSDHAPTRQRSSTTTSCIRTRKDWMIEYTMYISSRDGGTHPFRRMNAKEFHEMQWKSHFSQTGKLIGEKSVDLTDISWNSDADRPAEASRPAAHQSWLKSKILSPRSEIRDIGCRIFTLKKSALGSARTSLLAGRSGVSTTSLREMLQSRSSLRVNEWEIPNAIFARKFGLYRESRPLPPSIKELPVAEDKAIDVVTSPAMRELMYSWGFQGPFTPQLWFDSGLDYRWKRS